MLFSPPCVVILMLSGLSLINCKQNSTTDPTAPSLQNSTDAWLVNSTPELDLTSNAAPTLTHGNTDTGPAGHTSAPTSGSASDDTVSPISNTPSKTSGQASTLAPSTVSNTTAGTLNVSGDATPSSSGPGNKTSPSKNPATTTASHNKAKRIAAFPSASFFGFALLAISVLCL